MSGWALAGKGCMGKVVKPKGGGGAAYRHPSCTMCARGSVWSGASAPPVFPDHTLCPQRLPL